MLKIMRHHQRGISLVEILIGLSIALVIVVAVFGIFTSTFTGSQRVLERGKLDRDLYSIMDIIVSDIQRAGFWVNATNISATNGTAGSTNPFLAGTNDITTNGATNCLTFTYDSTTDGTVDDTDKFGYGLSGSAIRFRQVGSTFDCASASGWTSLSDTNVITITGFNVTSTNTAVNINTNTTSTINYRKVTVTITGNLKNDTTNTRTLTRTIKIYNNKYSP